MITIEHALSVLPANESAARYGRVLDIANNHRLSVVSRHNDLIDAIFFNHNKAADFTMARNSIAMVAVGDPEHAGAWLEKLGKPFWDKNTSTYRSTEEAHGVLCGMLASISLLGRGSLDLEVLHSVIMPQIWVYPGTPFAGQPDGGRTPSAVLLNEAISEHYRNPWLRSASKSIEEYLAPDHANAKERRKNAARLLSDLLACIKDAEMLRTKSVYSSTPLYSPIAQEIIHGLCHGLRKQRPVSAFMEFASQ